MNENTLVPKLRFPGFEENNWLVVALSELGETINGLNGKSGQDFGSGKPFVTYKQVFDSSKVDFSECGKVEIREDENQNTLQKGDILFTTSSETPHEVGFASVILTEPTEPTYLNSFCFAFRPFSLEQLLPEFSRYLFHSPTYRKSIGVLAQGITRFNISKGGFLKLAVPLPKNGNEQQRIASCLSSLDEVITAESQKLEVLKQHKKGLLQNLFPQEGENVPKLRFKEFEDSGEWVVKKLGAMSENVMYGMNAAAIEFDGENKYIRITDIDENTRLFSPNPLTSPDGQLDNKYFLKAGDILFARTGARVGKSYLHQKENGRVYFAGFLIRFTIKNAIPYFVYLQTLTEQYQKWVSKTSMRSGQPGINAEEYKSYSIYLPPSEKEQQRIASCLSSLDETIQAQAEKIELLKQHKKGLLQGWFPNINEHNG